MDTIITQKVKEVLKNKIFSVFSQKLYEMINIVFESITSNDVNSRYLSLISNLQNSTRNIIKSTIVSLFEAIDTEYKDSKDRLLYYYISKTNVKRTIITVVGEISFERTYYKDKNTGKCFFYIDSLFNLPKYDHYDPILKGIAINNAFHTSQAQSAKTTSSIISDITYFSDYDALKDIPRQSIFNWIKKWNVPNIIPDSVDTPENLYVMADEKYIGCQDLKKDLMIKSFVTFEGIEQVGKHRRKLLNRSTFSCNSSSAWVPFMDFIAKKYDFSKIKNIYLLGDGAYWIREGAKELKLNPTNNVNFYLCEFHFKQAIHHITRDKDERNNLIQLVQNDTKKALMDRINTIILDNPTRQEVLNKKQKYLSKNYAAIKRMLDLDFGSSMESHISHLIASFFAARPKGYSSKTIDKYLKLIDFKNNNYNIFNIYMNSYSNKEVLSINRKELDFSLFDKSDTTSIPILKRGEVSPIYNALHHLI